MFLDTDSGDGGHDFSVQRLTADGWTIAPRKPLGDNGMNEYDYPYYRWILARVRLDPGASIRVHSRVGERQDCLAGLDALMSLFPGPIKPDARGAARGSYLAQTGPAAKQRWMKELSLGDGRRAFAFTMPVRNHADEPVGLQVLGVARHVHAGKIVPDRIEIKIDGVWQPLPRTWSGADFQLAGATTVEVQLRVTVSEPWNASTDYGMVRAYVSTWRPTMNTWGYDYWDGGLSYGADVRRREQRKLRWLPRPDAYRAGRCNPSIPPPEATPPGTRRVGT